MCLQMRAREQEEKYEIDGGPQRGRLNKEQLVRASLFIFTFPLEPCYLKKNAGANPQGSFQDSIN